MISIQRFVCNMFQENCYVVSDDTRECAIIDCGASYEEEKRAIEQYISQNSLKPVALIATHGHLDHNFGNQFILDTYGLKPQVSAEDEQLLAHIGEQVKSMLGLDYNEPNPPAESLFEDGDTLTFGNHTLSVIATPGHSKGSVMLYCQEEGLLFSGDTLFRMSIGRTDFQGGSYQEIRESLKKVCSTLPRDTVVLPGHGPETTIGDEATYNPYAK